MELDQPFNPQFILGNEQSVPYTVTCALLESLEGGSHTYQRNGTIQMEQSLQPTPNGQFVPIGPKMLTHNVVWEGWRHEF